MGANSVILLAVLGAWAFFLIPHLVRRHAEINGIADVPGFSFDSLARRGSGLRRRSPDDAQDVADDAASSDAATETIAPAAAPVDVAPAQDALATDVAEASDAVGEAPVAPVATRRPVSAAARRRRILMGLTGLVVAAGVATVAGLVHWGAVAGAGLLLAGYIGILIATAPARARARAARQRPGVTEVVVEDVDFEAAPEVLIEATPAVAEAAPSPATAWLASMHPVPVAEEAGFAARPSRHFDLADPESWSVGHHDDVRDDRYAVRAG